MVNIEDFLKNTKGEIPLETRLEILGKIEKTIRANERLITTALEMDLNKTKLESYLTEIALVYAELRYFKKNLKKLMKPIKVKKTLKNHGMKFSVLRKAHGNVLIFGPWNYPFFLLVMPIIGAIAGGNRVVVKPSEFTKFTSKQVKELFEPFEDYILVQEGNADVANHLLSLKFDFVFFTGSTRVGKIVAQKCSANLTPYHLELGGKSPVIVDDAEDLEFVTDKIAYGKMINSGQTCVAPDYLLVNQKIEKVFIDKLKASLQKAVETNKYKSIAKYTMNPERIEGLIFENKDQQVFDVPFGENQSVALIKALDNSKLWKEEIFGTVFPYKVYSEIEEAIDTVNSIDSTPLVMYLYSSNPEIADIVERNTNSGSFVVNDTLVQLSNNNAPFGGVGTSGQGRYFSKHSFNAFTYERSIVKTTKSNGIKIRNKITEQNLKKYRKLLEK